MSLRTEYDTWHGKYQELDPTYDDTSTPWYQWVAKVIGNVEGLRTLEVACGRGGFVRKLAHSSAFSVGLDFSHVAVSIGKQRWETKDLGTPASFIQGDAHTLPFPDEFFDIVVSCETIEHLPEPLRGVQELYRVVRPSKLSQFHGALRNLRKVPSSRPSSRTAFRPRAAFLSNPDAAEKGWVEDITVSGHGSPISCLSRKKSRAGPSAGKSAFGQTATHFCADVLLSGAKACGQKLMRPVCRW